ncbi:MAG: hypothetical protein RMJ37_05765 [Spirochaetia bacterium]|nr:hypothetical protein [Spirochaetota bacterium]MDW8112822.1 hypothetical protein [Spirochaetia bacterium]
MELTNKIRVIQLLGLVNFVVVIILSLVLLTLSTSITLLIFDFNYFIPTLVFVFLIVILITSSLVFVIIRLSSFFLLSYSKIETLIFSRRRFLIDSLVEAHKKGFNLLNNSEVSSLDLSLTRILKNQTLTFIGLLIATILVSNLLLIENRGLKEFLNFTFADPKVEYSKFVSLSIPFRVEVIPNYSGEFFVSAERTIALERSNNTFIGEMTTTSTNIQLFVRKYGLIRHIRTLTPKYLSEFTLLNQRIDIFYRDIPIASYDYIPSTEVVRGSRVVMNFEFSYDVSKVSSGKGSVWKYGDKSNKIIIPFVAKSNSVMNINITDVFGRQFKIENVTFLVRDNDIPIVEIKYPDRDLTLIPRFVLDGYGEITDSDRIVSSWMEVIVSNSLTGLEKRFNTNNKNISFSYDGNFKFSLNSSGFLPGDYISVYVYAKDLFGAVGVGKRSIYIPTFSQIARMLNQGLQDLKDEVSKQKDDTLNTRYQLSRRNVSQSKISEKLQSLKSLSTNLVEFSRNVKDIYQQLDRTGGLKEEFERLEQISTKLERLLNDKEFREIVDKLSRDKTFEPSQVSKKLEDITKALNELEMEINRILEFRDVLKSISDLRELEESLKEGVRNRDLSEFDEKLKEFLKSEEFSRMSSEFKTSFLDKVKQLERSLKERKMMSESEISNFFKDIDFEMFREIMRNYSEMTRRQNDRFWETYFGILSSQYRLSVSRKNIDKLGLRENKINTEFLREDFGNVSQALKDFRLVVRDFLDTFSVNPSTAGVYSEIEYAFREIEKDFNLFTDAISSGAIMSVSLSVLNMIDKTSFTLAKLLELYDELNDSFNLSPSGVSASELMEMYRQISKMLKEMVEEGFGEEEVRQLEKMLEEAIRKARELENKSAGGSQASKIREELEDILNKVKERKLQVAYDKTQRVEFNILEYEKGMFERGISERREAEKPKEYKPINVTNIVDTRVNVNIKDSHIRKKYLELINRYRKMVNEVEE